MRETPADPPEDTDEMPGSILQIFNGRHDPLEYAVEPWGYCHQMQPEATFTLVSYGPGAAHLKCVFKEAHIATWNDAASVAALFHDEQLLFDTSIAVPPYPSRLRWPALPIQRSAAHRVELLLPNKDKRSLTLWTPADSRQYSLPPGTTCAVVVEGAAVGPISLELQEEIIVLHGWPESQFVVLEQERR